MQSVRERLYEIMARLRPNAVAIVDSLDFSDRELNSVLGRRDGNVYPALLEWAQKSPINREEVLFCSFPFCSNTKKEAHITVNQVKWKRFGLGERGLSQTPQAHDARGEIEVVMYCWLQMCI